MLAAVAAAVLVGVARAALLPAPKGLDPAPFTLGVCGTLAFCSFDVLPSGIRWYLSRLLTAGRWASLGEEVWLKRLTRSLMAGRWPFWAARKGGGVAESRGGVAL